MSLHHVGVALAAGVLLLLTGCEQSAPAVGATTTRPIDMAQVARGRALFSQSCARCHGAGAEGAADWRHTNADGTFPPPPLNGTGHAWHHPAAMLHAVIRDGTEPQGHMPGWGGTLSDAQIDDIIAWFQSLWPDEVYQAWWAMEQRSHQARQ